jgi:hypothetical protein
MSRGMFKPGDLKRGIFITKSISASDFDWLIRKFAMRTCINHRNYIIKKQTTKKKLNVITGS